MRRTWAERVFLLNGGDLPGRARLVNVLRFPFVLALGIAYAGLHVALIAEFWWSRMETRPKLKLSRGL
jgi:cytochrome c oxidase subunit IV